MSSKGASVITVLLLCCVFVLSACTQPKTVEDHPYYLDWNDTRQAMAQVIDAREDNLFIFPTDAPNGINYLMSYSSNPHLKQVFYVYKNIRINTCISTPPETCLDPNDEESQAVTLYQGNDGPKQWHITAEGIPDGYIVAEVGDGTIKRQSNSLHNFEEWGNLDSLAIRPPEIPAVDRILELWASYEFTTSEEPDWISKFAVDPPVCTPECY